MGGLALDSWAAERFGRPMRAHAACRLALVIADRMPQRRMQAGGLRRGLSGRQAGGRGSCAGAPAWNASTTRLRAPTSRPWPNQATSPALLTNCVCRGMAADRRA
jgi:hypothetical protein